MEGGAKPAVLPAACCADKRDVADLCESCQRALVDRLMADPAFRATLACWEERNAR